MNVYPIRCRLRAEAGVTRVDVYDDIGEGGWFSEGVSAKSFAGQLAGVKGALEVHINSGGGDVFDGIAIGNAIRAHKGPVTTVVDGIAASIASVIAQAGTDRVVQAGSMMMIHDAFGMCMGNAGEMAKFADTLDQVSANLAEIYASRAGGSASGWRDAMREESWYTAEEAVAAGLADRVGDGQAELPAGLDVAAFALPGRIAAALRKLPRAAYDPDGDGDDDSTPAGDTDHDYQHAPYTGTHSHPHAAYGSQGSDGSHEHEHSHDGDAHHGHAHPADLSRAEIAALRRLLAADGHMCGPACDPGCTCSGMSAHAHPDVSNADKYKQADRDRMAKSGEAMPDGSYPIADEEDLDNAIRAVGRGGADHDAIRKHIIKRAKALGLSSKIPDNWNADGSLKTADDHHDAGLNWSPDRFRASLERKDK